MARPDEDVCDGLACDEEAERENETDRVGVECAPEPLRCGVREVELSSPLVMVCCCDGSDSTFAAT